MFPLFPPLQALPKPKEADSLLSSGKHSGLNRYPGRGPQIPAGKWKAYHCQADLQRK